MPTKYHKISMALKNSKPYKLLKNSKPCKLLKREILKTIIMAKKTDNWLTGIEVRSIEIGREFRYPALGVVFLITFLIFLIVSLTLIVSKIDSDFITTSSNTLIRLGPVGDYIGGLLNPFVALCALVGLMISVRIQRETLRSTNKSLENSRKSIREQLDQDNFFVLLSNRESAVENIRLQKFSHQFLAENSSDIEAQALQSFQGRAAIREILNYIGQKSDDIFEDRLGNKRVHTKEAHTISFAREIKSTELDMMAFDFLTPDLDFKLENRVKIFAILYSGLEEIQFNKLSLNLQIKTDTLISDFRKTYQVDSIEELLGHIFRSTYQVLKFVYYSDFDDNKKRDLVNYLRAQMSETEFAAFALTALTNIGVKSRAVSIAFHLYEKRLLSTPWAKPLAKYFDPNDQDNVNFAKKLQFEKLYNSQIKIRSTSSSET